MKPDECDVKYVPLVCTYSMGSTLGL